jgi:predicted TIM-barrel fold metal-dependent hydrolase
VTLDLCWVYVISPAFAARLLDEMTETVPQDKVLGFGGDYSVVEGAYAHSLLCRETVSRVLADKVRQGYWTQAEAAAYARALLHDNAVRVFKLDNRVTAGVSP